MSRRRQKKPSVGAEPAGLSCNIRCSYPEWDSGMLCQQREQLAIEDWLAEDWLAEDWLAEDWLADDWLCPRLVLSSTVTAGSRPVRFRNPGFFSFLLFSSFPSKRHKLMSLSAEMKCGNDYLVIRRGVKTSHNHDCCLTLPVKFDVAAEFQTSD